MRGLDFLGEKVGFQSRLNREEALALSLDGLKSLYMLTASCILARLKRENRVLWPEGMKVEEKEVLERTIVEVVEMVFLAVDHLAQDHLPL